MNFAFFKNRINQKLDDALESDVVFHCSSFGEYLSIKPIALSLKKSFPHLKMIISFFSTSGFENLTILEPFDTKLYSPIDCINQVDKWLDIVAPKIVIISQNEIWPTFLSQLDKRKIPFLFIDSYFNKNWKNKIWLSLNKNVLNKAEILFVQNTKVESFLNSFLDVKIENVGSIRNYGAFYELTQMKVLAIVKNFKADKKLLVLGSIDNSDMAVIWPSIQKLSDEWKVLIAPHNMDWSSLNNLIARLGNMTFKLYSNFDQTKSKYLILDQFNVLKHAYQYADLVYIGGGFGKGIHNVIEPHFFLKPIVIGPNYRKFDEAQRLVIENKIKVISDTTSFANEVQNVENKKYDCQNISSGFEEPNQENFVKVLNFLERLIKKST